jgi:hypothetical protein
MGHVRIADIVITKVTAIDMPFEVSELVVRPTYEQSPRNMIKRKFFVNIAFTKIGKRSSVGISPGVSIISRNPPF